MKLKATVGKVCLTLAIGEKNGRMGHTTMCTKPTNETSAEAPGTTVGATVTLEVTPPPNDEELAEYRRSVRSRIEHSNSRLFENACAAHARIVIDELLKSARETVLVYCGRLSAEIYLPLVETFKDALARDVNVRVLIENAKAETEELAKMLQEKQWIRQSTQPHDGELPHFILVDGMRYRMEVNDEEKRALVCAKVSDKNGTEKTAKAMKTFFDYIWDLQSRECQELA